MTSGPGLLFSVYLLRGCRVGARLQCPVIAFSEEAVLCSGQCLWLRHRRAHTSPHTPEPGVLRHAAPYALVRKRRVPFQRAK